MKSYFYLFGLAGILILCQNCTSSDKKLFERRIEVKSKTFIGGEHLMDPAEMAVLQKFLIVENNQAEPLIEVYDRSTGQLINRFLYFGKGPHEIQCGGILQPTTDFFYISDLFADKVFIVDMNKVVQDSNYMPIVCFSLDGYGENFVTGGNYLMGRNAVIGASELPDGRVLLLEPETKRGYYYGNFPDKSNVDERLTEVANAELYESSIALSPDQEKMAFTTFYADMIDLFRIEGNRCDVLWSYRNAYPTHLHIEPGEEGEMVALWTEESILYYVNNTASNRYVYSLYSGKKMTGDKYGEGDRVRVVSWDGKETFEYHLDRPVKRIAVSPDDKTLYGIGTNEEAEYEIYAFDLP